MQTRRSDDSTTFRAEVWFDDRAEEVVITRTDPGHRGQRLTFTFEQWEQIKAAVEHLFLPADVGSDEWAEVYGVASLSRN